MMHAEVTDEVRARLLDMRAAFPIGTITQRLDSLKELKVMVVGEVIIDEYVFCEALGKSGKDPMLALKYLSRERYAGGAAAVANHAADFCRSVALATYVGGRDDAMGFITGNLLQNVALHAVPKADSPTIVKTRFLDSYTRAKLLGVYDLNDDFLREDEENALLERLGPLVRDADVVIAIDYDHGLITSKVARFLEKNASFLAVNTQTNAANVGFHAVSKYSRADYVCTNESELRMDRRSRKGDIEKLMQELADRMGCSAVMITRGRRGTCYFDRASGLTSFPSVALGAVDRMGAGDAVLAVTAPLVFGGVEAEIVCFVANAVGALAVSRMGNSRPVGKAELFSSMEHLFADLGEPRI